MSSTMFPTLPGEVAVLSTGEFAVGLELNNAPSLEGVCRRFGNDANRALVWLIRFRALKTWAARDGVAQWMTAARMIGMPKATPVEDRGARHRLPRRQGPSR